MKLYITKSLNTSSFLYFPAEWWFFSWYYQTFVGIMTQATVYFLHSSKCQLTFLFLYPYRHNLNSKLLAFDHHFIWCDLKSSMIKFLQYFSWILFFCGAQLNDEGYSAFLYPILMMSSLLLSLPHHYEPKFCCFLFTICWIEEEKYGYFNILQRDFSKFALFAIPTYKKDCIFLGTFFVYLAEFHTILKLHRFSKYSAWARQPL